MTTRAISPLLVALLLTLSGAARAAGPPPSIDDLDGATFLLRAQSTTHDLLTGERSKGSQEIQTTITKTGPTTISFSHLITGMSYYAHYVDGFLVQGIAFDAGTPPEAVGLTLMEVSGQPGQLKLKGALRWYAVTAGQRSLFFINLSGRQIAP